HTRFSRDWSSDVCSSDLHSLNHPCSGNFPWSRDNALEEYSLDKMRNELAEANRQIENLLGIDVNTFAYPCGQTFVGRGMKTQSRSEERRVGKESRYSRSQ